MSRLVESPYAEPTVIEKSFNLPATSPLMATEHVVMKRAELAPLLQSHIEALSVTVGRPSAQLEMAPPDGEVTGYQSLGIAVRDLIPLRSHSDLMMAGR
jgi:hypothetical protein